jgi:Ca-activated chloride channel family protein
MMREELSEKVETVYAEEYAWPLGLAVVLLLAEGFLGEAPRRDRTTSPAGRRNDARTSPRSTTPPSADVPSAPPKRGREDKEKREASP